MASDKLLLSEDRQDAFVELTTTLDWAYNLININTKFSSEVGWLSSLLLCCAWCKSIMNVLGKVSVLTSSNHEDKNGMQHHTLRMGHCWKLAEIKPHRPQRLDT